MTRPLTITVHGTPAGQGRLTFLGVGRGAKHSNEKQLKPWRTAIIKAAVEATGRHPFTEAAGQLGCAVCNGALHDHPLHHSVPVCADITVTVPKPKSAPKRIRTWPITRSSTDIDHHARACLDALSQSGVVYRDDSQVVDLRVRKVYPGEHRRALAEPGVTITIREVKW